MYVPFTSLTEVQFLDYMVVQFCHGHTRIFTLTTANIGASPLAVSVSSTSRENHIELIEISSVNKESWLS